MKIYTCKDRLEDIMTCIYDAWADALLIGHDQIRLKKEPIFQATLLDEYIHVDGDCSKQKKSPDLSAEIFLPEHICMCITHPFQQKKTHCRQSIIFYELDFPWERVYSKIIPIHM